VKKNGRGGVEENTTNKQTTKPQQQHHPQLGLHYQEMHGASDKVSGKKTKQTKVEGTTTNQPTNQQAAHPNNSIIHS
jgi:hypothetical protein